MSRSNGTFRRVLKMGKLTGREVALMVIQADMAEAKEKKPAFTDEELRLAMQNLASPEDRRTFDEYMSAWRQVKTAILVGKLFSLQAQRHIWHSQRALNAMLVSLAARLIRRYSPAIMTAKQYQEMKAGQRERKLQELVTLWEVLDEQATETERELLQQWEDTEDTSEQFLDHLRAHYPEQFRAIVQSLISLIQEGRLRPVAISEPEAEAIEAQQEAISEAGLKVSAEAWTALYEQKTALIREAFERGREALTQEALDRVRAGLEHYRDGQLDEEAADRLLDRALLSRQECYEAGLPYTVRMVEEFWPGYLEGEPEVWNVAILQEPKKWQEDERGWYVDALEEPLKLLDVSIRKIFVPEPEDELGLTQVGDGTTKSSGATLVELLPQNHRLIRKNIREFLGVRAVVSQAADIMGVPEVTEELEAEYTQLGEALEGYNDDITSKLYQEGMLFTVADMPAQLRMAPIRMEWLQYTQESLDRFRDWLRESLGASWWEGEPLHSMTWVDGYPESDEDFWQQAALELYPEGVSDE